MEGDLIFTEYLFVPFEFCGMYMLPNQKRKNLVLRIQWSPEYCFVSLLSHVHVKHFPDSGCLSM